MSKPKVNADDVERLNTLLQSRLEEGMTLTEFAARAGEPLSPALIYQHRTGRTPISLDAAIAYAEGFGVPISDLCPQYETILRRGAACLSKPSEAGVPHILHEPRPNYRTSREQQLIDVFRALPEALREQLLSYAKGMEAASRSAAKKIG